ncbi:hypothetical protein I3J27_34495 [Bradyrhizobium xenonodulans]|uniref:Transposase n=1 Tax=Bradyrhizobium xenonodulans TaxID=2736875 RepID=A0ABY7MWF0_9BRAD|nr:hypothetical protein [Bradyrhizobium xenonodulans]WBL82762.1 hypothetical protein I3J27_34495 [Bradyrhizobium xenonodulans]
MDPQAWLARMLARLPGHPPKRIQHFDLGIRALRASPMRLESISS